MFNAVDLRWVILATRIGILRQPLNIKLFFSDRWVPNNSAERCQELREHALDRGLGIRVGIGECPLVFRTAANTEMVDRAVNLITKRGLTPDTQHDLRARFAAAEADESARIRMVSNRNRCL